MAEPKSRRCLDGWGRFGSVLREEGRLAGSGGTGSEGHRSLLGEGFSRWDRVRPATDQTKKIYGITSWVFYIRPINEARSRLLIRVRAKLGPSALKIIAWLVFGTGDAVFERTVLDGIKSRVENFEQLNI